MVPNDVTPRGVGTDQWRLNWRFPDKLDGEYVKHIEKWINWNLFLAQLARADARWRGWRWNWRTEQSGRRDIESTQSCEVNPARNWREISAVAAALQCSVTIAGAVTVAESPVDIFWRWVESSSGGPCSVEIWKSSTAFVKKDDEFGVVLEIGRGVYDIMQSTNNEAEIFFYKYTKTNPSSSRYNMLILYGGASIQV